MTWWLFVGLFLIVACARHVWRTWPRRNRRRTDVLGKPVVDPRSSIEQFRRIHTP